MFSAFFVIILARHQITELNMNVSVGERWEEFIERAVNAGRYGSASEVVREGLRLVEEREAKLQALRATLEASIAAGGHVSDETLDAALARRAHELRRRRICARERRAVFRPPRPPRRP